MNKHVNSFLAVLIFVLVGVGVYLNTQEKKAVDHSRIPEKVELSKGFQKWITNLKNKDFDINAEDFTLVEENEIYNTQWMKVYSLDEEGKQEELNQVLASHAELDKVAFSPSEERFIDYRNIYRDDYLPNQVRFYGQKEDKIIDSRVVDCSTNANCYFDRAYFIDNDTFVVSEFSRDIPKDNPDSQVCLKTDLCTYTIKVHVIDLVRNSRLKYTSKPFELVLSQVIPEL